MRDQLLLAQQVIGLAKVGIFASDRLIDSASAKMKEITTPSGALMFPQAIERLENLANRILPGQVLCANANNEISVVLRPLNAKHREMSRIAYLSSREQSAGPQVAVH